jgi:hypothetical protein
MLRPYADDHHMAIAYEPGGMVPRWDTSPRYSVYIWSRE